MARGKRTTRKPVEVEEAAADEFLLPPETGVEKAGECDGCGRDLPAVTSSYGSVRRGACGCSGGNALAAQVAAAEADSEVDAGGE